MPPSLHALFENGKNTGLGVEHGQVDNCPAKSEKIFYQSVLYSMGADLGWHRLCFYFCDGLLKEVEHSSSHDGPDNDGDNIHHEIGDGVWDG